MFWEHILTELLKKILGIKILVWTELFIESRILRDKQKKMTESTRKKILQLFHLTIRGREIQKKMWEREREREVGLVCLVDWWTYRAVRVISCLCYINFYSSLSLATATDNARMGPPPTQSGLTDGTTLSKCLSLSLSLFLFNLSFFTVLITIIA